jgi:hypothetical protein
VTGVTGGLKRQHRRGPGQHIKSGACYVRWRTPDGRHRDRRLGKIRTRGEKDELTRAQAEREARRVIAAENDQPSIDLAEPPPTVDEVVDQLGDRVAIKGARLSYRRSCASMQRVHISPAIGKRRVDSVVERLPARELRHRSRRRRAQGRRFHRSPRRDALAPVRGGAPTTARWRADEPSESSADRAESHRGCDCRITPIGATFPAQGAAARRAPSKRDVHT